MQVTNTTASQAATQTGNAATDTTAVNSDYDVFLQLLTAQVKNQDPLDPMSSDDFSSQLAQFSAVEQQVKTNDLLEALGVQMSVMGMGEMATWIGLDARAAAAASFDGSPISISPNPAASADRAVLVVRDSSGNEVQRQDFTPSTDEIQWAGVDGNGAPFASGLYTFEVESYSGDELIATTKAEIYSRVLEAKSRNGETILVLEGGVEVPSTSVSALRDPV
ncbi:flagellar hook capping FlgD N-terminal domain-containing protein [Profundibacter amoris]|uniref:Basal-body rod modification protein FlgD n=1 Tax=Profundibacter amoris TaxID=2171755 RepID=A0A347UL95_9RHOB|nr:flagellar hook capping FlgD N-terminal domain-containing protein [Profundibacter amoris]AXX99623.1 flagellar basal body rod modification protein [Profundibacter amoris]